MIPKEYRGKVFEQIAPRLRWREKKAGGVDSFRPVSDLTGAVVGDPPRITFADDADADVERWIEQGRIRVAADQNTKPEPPLSDADAHKKQPSQSGAESGGA